VNNCNNIYKLNYTPISMPEKDFDKNYGIDSDSSIVKDFHSNRRMFAIKDDKLFIAKPNVSFSHARWFEMEGWIKGPEDSMMNKIVRGFVNDEGIYFYKGYDFSVDVQSENVMAMHLEQLVELTSIDVKKHLYGGMIKQNAPGKWPPRKDYGVIANYLRNRIY
jgi:hypothetical protein